MNNIIGLDLSLSSTGVAVRAGITTIRPKTLGVQRLYEVSDRLVDIIRNHKPDVAIIEGYAFGAHDRGSRAIGELGGVIRLALYTKEIPFVDVPPAVLKKFATGRGNANKDAVLTAATLVNHKIRDNNAADAWWLYQMGAAHYGGSMPVTIGKERRKIVDAIEWPELARVIK